MSEQLISEAVGKIFAQGPLFATFILIVITGYKQFWVYGWSYREVVKDRDYYRNIVNRTLDAAEKISNVKETR